jgi:hypothetical protein
MHFSQLSGPFDLSFQDKYILAFEREDLPFNSHLVLEVEGDIDIEKCETTFQQLIEREPFTLILPDAKTGRFRLRENAEGIKIHVLKEDELDAFWDKMFIFPDEVAVRMGIVPGKKIIFSFHHALFDGHAQFNFLKDFLDIYLGKNYQPRTLQDVYKFRKYFSGTKLIWYLKNLLPLLKVQKKKGKTKIARLYDCEPVSRKVDMELIELDRKIMDSAARKLALSSSAFISLIGARTMDKILSERGETEKPIVLYITKSMRFEFKVMRAYQNLLGFIWMKINRSELQEKDFPAKFRDTYKFRSGEDEVKKTLFLGALLVKLKSFSELKKILRYKEERIHDCTLLVSSGRTPAEVQFPDEWKIARLYAKGSMHRSPGIGLLVTSFKQKDFVCIEYLRDSFKPETIARFKELLLKELQE